MMALKGIDVSHHNKQQFLAGQIKFEKHDFVIVKATEGRTYVDPMYDDYMSIIDSLVKPYGIYHYARPENNDAIAEAKHFCDTIRGDGKEALLVLDWEAKATTCDISWALDWLRYVEKVYGKKPLIYCSSWYTKKLKPVYENGNGLWVAHYTKNKPKVYTYPFYALWQYSSEPYDKDIFNGNKSQWLKYSSPC